MILKIVELVFLLIKPLPSFSTSAERRECRDKATNITYMYTQSPHTQSHAQPQKIFNPAFNTSYPNHWVVSLKKTWGWNQTLLLALHRLEPSSCHCDCHYHHVSNGRPANVSHPRGTWVSPPALCDWGAIYLSASTSTPALPNPPFCWGRWASMENTCSHTTKKTHQCDGSQTHLNCSETSVCTE